jgi:hypothetical protein
VRYLQRGTDEDFRGKLARVSSGKHDSLAERSLLAEQSRQQLRSRRSAASLRLALARGEPRGIVNDNDVP